MIQSARLSDAYISRLLLLTAYSVADDIDLEIRHLSQSRSERHDEGSSGYNLSGLGCTSSTAVNLLYGGAADKCASTGVFGGAGCQEQLDNSRNRHFPTSDSNMTINYLELTNTLFDSHTVQESQGRNPSAFYSGSRLRQSSSTFRPALRSPE